MRPVRPIAPVWMLASLLVLISAIISIACAGSIGMYGIRKLSVSEIGAIFPALAIFTCLAALLSVARMTPGGFRWKMTNAGTLLLIIVAGWVALDAALFHDYALGAFVPQGIPCLRAGLVVAIPTGVASWIVLRRGFAVRPSSAGLAAGTLAGLAGLTMLELHCPILLAPHVMVWHTAVVPLSALAGAFLARIATSPAAPAAHNPVP
jgi:hypothetical protein